jgi:hypothetical protein
MILAGIICTIIEIHQGMIYESMNKLLKSEKYPRWDKR